MRERFLKLNKSAIRGRNRSFYLSATSQNIMGKSSKSGDDDFPLGKEFLDGISRAHADFVDDYNSGVYDSDDDEGFDEEEGAPASYPANNGGSPAMIDIMEEHCRTFFEVTRIDGKRVEAVCGRPTKDCLLHRLTRRPDRCAPAGRYVRVEMKRNLAVGSVDEGVRPFSESSDEESAGEIAEKTCSKVRGITTSFVRFIKGTSR